MLSFYIYISLLLITIAFILICLHLSRWSPLKIKIITIFIAAAMMLRYISLLILSLSYNIKYLYLLKPAFFLNLIVVPILALTVLYIFIRIDNVNFSYIFILTAALIFLYSMVIYKCPSIVELTGENGYTLLFAESAYVYWTYIGLNTIVLFVAIALIIKKAISKIGTAFIIMSSFGTILEVILWFIGIKILQESIIGDMLWIVTLVYVLNKVSKRGLIE